MSNTRQDALDEARALVEASIALLDAHALAADAGPHLSLGLHYLSREAERLQPDARPEPDQRARPVA